MGGWVTCDWMGSCDAAPLKAAALYQPFLAVLTNDLKMRDKEEKKSDGGIR